MPRGTSFFILIFLFLFLFFIFLISTTFTINHIIVEFRMATRGRPRIHNAEGVDEKGEPVLKNPKAVALYATLNTVIDLVPNNAQRNENIRKRILECKDTKAVNELHHYLGQKSNHSVEVIKKARASIDTEYSRAKPTREQKAVFKKMEEAEDEEALEAYDNFLKLALKEVAIQREVAAFPEDQKAILRNLHNKSEQELNQSQLAFEYGLSLSRFCKARVKQFDPRERAKDIIITTGLDDVCFRKENKLFQVPSSQQTVDDDDGLEEYDVDESADEQDANDGASDAATDVVS
jgi:hypothetical protein